MMKSNCQSVHRRQTSSQEFLFCKTERLKNATSGGEKSAETSFSTSEAIRQQFPQLRIGDAFVRYSLERIASTAQFASMVIRIDQRDREETAAVKHRFQESMLEIAQTIDTICAAENGFWGQLDIDTCGCFFPDKNGYGCRALSEKIKTAVASNNTDTVSIGIASYPMINFNRCQILENAAKALDHATFFGPDSMVVFDAVSLNISGDKFYQAGEIEKATRDYQMALKIDPSNVNIHNSLGVSYGVTGSLEKALEEFETAIWLDPGEVMAIHNAGIIYQMMGMPDKAIEFFQKAASLDTDVFEIVFHTGRLFVEMNQPEQAKSYLEKAIQLKPASGIAWRYLGDCYSKIKKRNQAVRAYKNAIKQNPEDASSLSALGFLYHLNDENAEIATVFCQQSTLLVPENGLFRQRLGQIYLSQNRIKEALTEFKKAHALGADSMDWIDRIKKQLIPKAS